MAGVHGDFRGLARLRRAVEESLAPTFRRDLAMAMGAAAFKSLADEFRQSRDPYGKPWAPLRLRRGKPLLDTGRMRASATIAPRPAGFEIAITAAYAATHQYGATIRPRRARVLAWKVRGSGKAYFARQVRIPRRQMIPEASTGGLGPIWREAMQKAADLYVRRHFRGRGPR